ncbi:hypothetical protein NDU88_003664 [Pleurodeles waltl]|uniref:Uncharacterized protein n=1 Tax=Pleurodeles waltl TaxID=8319 RepID=A0AAV7MEE8_PLEWA|nr:hypothetical protein NDU88_003664 [Pleurodeles waltl]
MWHRLPIYFKKRWGLASYQLAMEAYLYRVGPLKVEPIVKKKGQKRKSKGLGKGPSAKKGTPLRSKTETVQENSEWGWHKCERTATPLKDITMKLQNIWAPATVESDAALNEPDEELGPIERCPGGQYRNLRTQKEDAERIRGKTESQETELEATYSAEEDADPAGEWSA